MELFYTGLHQPSDAKHFARACISINRLIPRKKRIGDCKVFGDSGAFTALLLNGRFIDTVAQLAAHWRRIIESGVADVEVIVAQDFMCEPFMLARTDATDVALARMRGRYGPVERRKLVRIHQRWTIERYDALLAENLPCLILPVLQGFDPVEYKTHVAMYGDRLKPGHWTGVGSVCKRNANPAAILTVLSTIKAVRPDLRLHGFGVKLTSLKNAAIRALLFTADSMAWSFSARKQGRSANDWREAIAFEQKVLGSPAAL